MSKNCRYENPYTVKGSMCYLIASKQAQRNYLRIYERIRLLERGKLITWRTYFPKKCWQGKTKVITCFNISESSGTVPLKLAKASGGIATSQLNRKAFIL